MEREEPHEARDERGHVRDRVERVQGAHQRLDVEQRALERDLARQVQELLGVPHRASVREALVDPRHREAPGVLPHRVQREHERGLARERA